MAALFWSGGKDSAFALFTILRNAEFNVVTLVTTLSSDFKRISMHGIREELLEKQAEATGIPLLKMWVPNEPTNKAYESELHKTLSMLKSSGIDHIIFGDIFLEDLKEYRDTILNEHQLTGVYPLWKRETSELIRGFLANGFRTITCCINSPALDKSMLGREIGEDFLKELPLVVDPCGENGEFHTFCFDGPIFHKPVNFATGEERFAALNIKGIEQEEEKGFWYIDLI